MERRKDKILFVSISLSQAFLIIGYAFYTKTKV